MTDLSNADENAQNEAKRAIRRRWFYSGCAAALLIFCVLLPMMGIWPHWLLIVVATGVAMWIGESLGI